MASKNKGSSNNRKKKPTIRTKPANTKIIGGDYATATKKGKSNEWKSVSVFVLLLGIILKYFHDHNGCSIFQKFIPSSLLQNLVLDLPNEPNEETKIQNFLSWLRENGATIAPSVTIAPFPEFGGYGLQAMDDSRLGDENNVSYNTNYAIQYLDDMFTIPQSVIISSRSIIEKRKNQIPNFQQRITQLLANYVPSSSMVQQDVLIALDLMVECTLGERSTFKPYLDILPQYVIPRLDTFNDEELRMLQDEELAHLARESYNQLLQLWQSDSLQKIISAMVEVEKQVMNYAFEREKLNNDRCMSFDSFHKFVSIVSSRAMVLKGIKYLTPLAEFANYKSREDERKVLKGRMGQSFMLYHERNDEDGSITVRADRNVISGMQIFEDYGDIDNSLYLEAHGFVPHENPFHCAAIPSRYIVSPRELPRVLRDAMIALRILPEKNSELYPPPTICILEDGSISEKNAEAYLTVAALDFHDSNNDLTSGCADALDSKDEEFIQLQCLHYIGHKELLNRSIKNLSHRAICNSESSLKDDLILLDELRGEESKTDNLKKILALEFRISDKIILNKVTGGMENINCSSDDSTQLTLEKCPLIKTTEVTSSSERNEKFLLQAFNTLIDNLDMPVQKIEAALVGEEMRLGVVAKEDINENEVYLSISNSSVIDADTAKVEGRPQMNIILEYHRALSRDGGSDVLLLFLLHEKFISKEQSKWAAYIDILPSIDEMKQSTPLFFDDSMYDYAAGSELRPSLIRNKRKAEDLFVAFSLNKDIMKVLGPKVMQMDNFFWAYTIINSRSIWWNGKRHLVPLLDLVNCMELRNSAGRDTSIHKTLLDESNYAVTKASKKFEKGDQLFENYGQPNYVYYTYHGFTLGDDNSHDCARLGGLAIVPSDKGAADLKETRTKLSNNGFNSMKPFFCVRDASSLDGITKFLQIKHGAQTAFEVEPHLREFLSNMIKRYSITKRSSHCSDKNLPGPVQYMLQIVDREQILLERALNSTTSN